MPGDEGSHNNRSFPEDLGTHRYAYYGGEFIPFEDLESHWHRVADMLDEGDDLDRGRLPVEAMVAYQRNTHVGNPARDHWLWDWGKVEPDRLLYHYTSRERLLDIMHSKALRMSSLDTMRDPREFMPWRLGRFVLEGTTIDVDAIEAEASRVRLATKVTCFGRDRVPPRDENDLADPVLNPHRGKGFLRPRMWEQYGDAHQGVCLVFDRERVDATFADHLSTLGDDPVLGEPRPFNGPVRYDDSADARALASQLGFIDDDYSHDAFITSKEWIRGAFLTKDEDWRTEHEYRWGLMTANPGHVDVPLDPGCLLGVVLGLKWKRSWDLIATSFAEAFTVSANMLHVVWQGDALDYRLFG